METILLIDDEQRMLDLLELFLSPHGYHCLKAMSGEQGIALLKEEQVDLVLLDIMMPNLDGWEVCQAIREFSNVPVIMLTARSDKKDLIKGLNKGADDYITKPFDEGELIARVQAVMRRYHSENSTANIVYGHYLLNRETYSLHYKQHHVQLTLKEFYIIEALIEQPKRTFTRDQLMHIAWDYDTYTDIRTIDSHIRNLRDKLKNAGFPQEEFLKTVWGIGYKWS